MSPARTDPTPLGEGDGEIVRCGYCPCNVVFRTTYLDGQALCFDANFMPRVHDHQRTGWIVGEFPIGGTLRRVWAPWNAHPSEVRRRAFLVAQLHNCSGSTKYTGTVAA